MSINNQKGLIEAQKIFMETTEGLHKRVLDTIDQLNKGFDRVMLMYTVVFYSGIAFIFFSIAASLDGRNVSTSILGGSVGVVEVIAFIVFKPIEDLQKSRAKLVQLNSTFLSWFNDLHNWNGAIAKEIEDKNNFDSLEKFSSRIVTNTFAITMMMSIFMKEDSSENTTETLQKMIHTFQEKVKNVKF